MCFARVLNEFVYSVRHFFSIVILASEPVAEIIENYRRDYDQQQQQLPAGSVLPPDIFVKLQFGGIPQVGFVLSYN